MNALAGASTVATGLLKKAGAEFTTALLEPNQYYMLSIPVSHKKTRDVLYQYIGREYPDNTGKCVFNGVIEVGTKLFHPSELKKIAIEHIPEEALRDVLHTPPEAVTEASNEDFLRVAVEGAEVVVPDAVPVSVLGEEDVVAETLPVPAAPALKPQEIMLLDTLGQIPEKNGTYKAALKLAAAVLEPRELSAFIYKVRPMPLKKSKVPLPASVTDELAKFPKEEFSTVLQAAFNTVLASHEYKKVMSFGTSDVKKACQMISDLGMAVLAKAATPAADRKAMAPAAVSKAAVQPAAVAVVKAAPVAATPAAMPAASADEAQFVKKFSPNAGLLGYFSEVAGLGPKAIGLLSRVLLREVKMTPANAAADLGLDFADAAVMAEGAVQSIRKHAKAGKDEFVVKALAGFKFGPQ